VPCDPVRPAIGTLTVMRISCESRRAPHPATRALPALVAVAALVLACLSLGLAERVVDPADGDHHGPRLTQLVGDDLGPAVLPAVIALAALATAGSVIAGSTRPAPVLRVTDRRGRAPPHGIDR
jgi:hypothetical protein